MRCSWDNYFLSIASVVSMRSTCTHRHVGCIIVKDKHILSTGYNGSPTGLEHCTEVGCLKDENKLLAGLGNDMCRACHAEQNAIAQAARFGVSVEGATLYCNYKPCTACGKLIVNAGIKKVVYLKDYPHSHSDELFRQANIECIQISKGDL